MQYLAATCPICGDGVIGFRRCSDGQTLVLLCDECDTVWLDPQQIDAEHALYPTEPDFIVPTLDCSISAPASRWATRAEVELRGWGQYIAGEWHAPDEQR